MKLITSFFLWFGLHNEIVATILHWSADDHKQMATEFDVTYPIQVDQNGKFLAYYTKELQSKKRLFDVLKRSSKLSGNEGMTSEKLNDCIYLNITVFENTYRIMLKPKENLIAPEATVIQHAKQQFSENLMHSGFVFAGRVVGHVNSTVAITAFDGLAGYIKTDDGEFFIEPWEDAEETHEHAPQRHAIYKTENRYSISRASKDYIKRSGRSKRSTKSAQYTIEVLLIADDTVVRFHGSDRVQSYLVTLMNIVDEIYQDDSIGLSINVVIARLSYLSQEYADRLIAGNDPGSNLKRICNWGFNTHHINGGNFGAIAYDHAIFLTKRQFGPIGMQGYAHVTGMCHPLRSCTLNREDGFSSAFVVAHETGHVLGMEHDGEGNKCGDDTSMGSIMAPLVQAAFHRYHWSRCSQHELKGNIRKFHCLLNSPHASAWNPDEEYPGVHYSLNDQCRFDFGPGYRHCTAFQNIDICQTLWCSHGDNPLFCKTKNGPPVDGTECAENMWCFKSHCVWKSQRIVSVDGQWGQWSLYELCSRSCGTGVKIRTRQCNRRRLGRRDCLGPNTEHLLCNTRPCAGSYDYRAEQCKYHQKKLYGKRRHTWLPHESEHDDLKCELFCVSKETETVLSMGSPVADGTTCSYDDPYNVCINAECVQVGCDRVIRSEKREDQCGVCDGDGSECRIINSTYKKMIRKPRNSYMKMFTLPVHARQVVLRETSSNDYPILALKNRRTGRYVLNEKGTVTNGDVQKQIIDGGTKWVYVKADGREDLHAVGPLSSEYAALVVLNSSVKKLKVCFSYVLHARNLNDASYQYEVRKWYSCSVTCGQGIRLPRFACRNKVTRKWVRKSFCDFPAPRRIRKPCSPKCQPRVRWSTSSWGACSVSCGNKGVKTRVAFCERHSEQRMWKKVNSTACRILATKPSLIKLCANTACPASWAIGNWSLCSVSCGTGLRQRQVSCSASGAVVSDERCSEIRPHESESCILQDCTDDTCKRDQSIFCKLSGMVNYCSIVGYHKLCCDLCRSQEERRGEN